MNLFCLIHLWQCNLLYLLLLVIRKLALDNIEIGDEDIPSQG